MWFNHPIMLKIYLNVYFYLMIISDNGNNYNNNYTNNKQINIVYFLNEDLSESALNPLTVIVFCDET